MILYRTFFTIPVPYRIPFKKVPVLVHFVGSPNNGVRTSVLTGTSDIRYVK
jgi:hypothetical protein